MKRILYILKHPLRIPGLLLIRLPYFRFIKDTALYQCPISLKIWFSHKILNRGENKNSYWPVHSTSKVVCPENIYAGIDTCPGLMGGCYIQGMGKIYIGDYTQLASNVAIISANHDLYDTRKHILGEVHIGKYSWLGTGVKIMPNVVLGDFTIVGAGAVVTKSFEYGHCIIAGNPARIIKELDKDKCVRYEYSKKYNGYIASDKFEEFRKKHLNV